MQEISFANITTDVPSYPAADEKDITVTILRLDKVHPLISGNKIFKLRYYLEEAKLLDRKKIITFGGAWSNHILATAAACQLAGFEATAYIRGEEPATRSSTLTEASQLGMKLIFVAREEYTRQKRKLADETGDAYIIHEGGYGTKGAEGAATIAQHFHQSGYTHICCAAGTGTMTAGLLMSALPVQEVISISVLKNNLQLETDIQALAGTCTGQLTTIHDYHFGGYAKYKPELIHFMNEWYRRSMIPSDFVYTGKLFFAIDDLIKNNFFPPGSKILLVHSGGLQGNTSLSKGTLIF
ncbi:MAG: pyridoxal-phosphate dependent enzyme [Chitinophagaceae bacterium]|nr:pyridoxal-phosphate dependent enzyme [Chitinophagaceae bacterium]